MRGNPYIHRLCTTAANKSSTRYISCYAPGNHLSLDLLSQDILQRNGISSELADSLAQLLDRHNILVEEESEIGLVVDVGQFFDVEAVGGGSIKLLRYRGVGI